MLPQCEVISVEICDVSTAKSAEERPKKTNRERTWGPSTAMNHQEEVGGRTWWTSGKRGVIGCFIGVSLSLLFRLCTVIEKYQLEPNSNTWRSQREPTRWGLKKSSKWKSSQTKATSSMFSPAASASSELEIYESHCHRCVTTLIEVSSRIDADSWHI